jgi:NAD-dependent aldehyde dehydrogenases
MAFVSIDPSTGQKLASYREHSAKQAAALLARSHAAFEAWRSTSLRERSRVLRHVARSLLRRREELARLITDEMGKPLAQSRAEIEKSALGCEFYAAHAAEFLSPRRPPHAPPNARVTFSPLGPVLAIMPWNFPFWQTLRAAAPTLMAGNTFLLKPAPATGGCGHALASLFDDARIPPDLFLTLLVDTPVVEKLIADPRLAAVTLTGSTRAGKSVAALAGAAMKPATFELGGSDAYLIFDDADLDLAAAICAQSRLINSGQSCIAAKRFLVVRRIRREFERRFVEKIKAARLGSPLDPATTVGPLARADLRDQLHAQVQRSLARGARVLLEGGPLADRPGFFYAPVVLTNVAPGMPAFDEELFGPVAAIVPVRDESEAIRLANTSAYGLGAGVFTRSRTRAQRVAAQLQAGSVAINDFVRSDPSLPFGGVKDSGVGRELAEWGLHAFTNIKTITTA